MTPGLSVSNATTNSWSSRPNESSRWGPTLGYSRPTLMWSCMIRQRSSAGSAYQVPTDWRIMQEHIEIGRGTPVEINTTYSFGLDDQEFVLAFETDHPGDFLDLVQELRTTESSAYTLRDTPIFTCIATPRAPGARSTDVAMHVNVGVSRSVYELELGGPQALYEVEEVPGVVGLERDHEPLVRSQRKLEGVIDARVLASDHRVELVHAARHADVHVHRHVGRARPRCARRSRADRDRPGGVTSTADAVAALRAADPVLAGVIDEVGSDGPGDLGVARAGDHYGALVRSIVGQRLLDALRDRDLLAADGSLRRPYADAGRGCRGRPR